MLSHRPKLTVLALIAACSLPLWAPACWSVNQASQEKFSFTILHSNDLHSHEDSFVDHGKTVGGLARIAHLIKTDKKNSDRVLAIDAGDMFQGTGYFEQYKGQSDIECLNKAGYDIVTLGNHDLDEGPANLGKQLKLAKFEVISCNLDVSSEPSLKEIVKPYTIKEIGGQKVAFIGVMTPALKEVQPHMEGLQIKCAGPNWMDPVKAEIQKVKEQGINKIVLVSHCGVPLERLLAEIPDVDVVVGGHSHTRLDEPIQVTHPDGSKAIVVQTGSYGRALGKLDLTFDKDGHLDMADTKYHLINITPKIFEDPELRTYITQMGKPFEADTKTVLAIAEANFDNRFKMLPFDSGIGDLVTDALFDASIDQGVTIALQNRGGLRSALEQGEITPEKVREVLPFQNKLIVATVTGKTLLRALENAVSAVAEGATGGRFLDVHGLKFAWDPTLELGHRIVFASAQNKEGAYEPIAADELYRIAMNDFSFNGGEGYDFKDAKNVVDTGLRLSTVLENYLKKKKQVAPSLPDRFTRVSSNIAKLVSDGKGDYIAIDYAVPNSTVTVLKGSDRSMSFLKKFGTVPLAKPEIIRTLKTADDGKAQLRVSEIVTSHGGKSGKGKSQVWICVILQTHEQQGSSTKIVSVPIQLQQ